MRLLSITSSLLKSPFEGGPILYASSLSDASWEMVAPFFETSHRKHPWKKHEKRTIVDACLYVVDNGTKWRNLPNDFPPWKTVYHYFWTWSLSGLWAQVSRALVEVVRYAAGREESPSLASVDSQSQTAEPGVAERGLDGGKKVNGRKRHVAVDCGGLLLACHCTSANTSDVVGGSLLAEGLNDVDVFPRMAKILGDNAYRGVARQRQVFLTS